MFRKDLILPFVILAVCGIYFATTAYFFPQPVQSQINACVAHDGRLANFPEDRNLVVKYCTEEVAKQYGLDGWTVAK